MMFPENQDKGLNILSSSSHTKGTLKHCGIEIEVITSLFIKHIETDLGIKKLNKMES